MQRKTNLNALVEECLVSLKLDSSSSCPLEEEKKSYASSISSVAPYPTFMDYPISPTRPYPSTLIGDYIGVESCLDLNGNVDFGSSRREYSTNGDQCRQLLAMKKKRKDKLVKREFPPPIPLLARTENLSSHMPWVLKRYYTDDGRLILREERVRHHEYFKAHRAGGRLTLQLVPMEDDFSFPPYGAGDDQLIENCHCSNEEEEEEEEAEGEREADVVDNEEDVQENTQGGENAIGEVEDSSGGGVAASSCLEGGNNNISGNGGNGSKCLSYSTVTVSSTCIFGVPVPALRPVS